MTNPLPGHLGSGALVATASALLSVTLGALAAGMIAGASRRARRRWLVALLALGFLGQLVILFAVNGGMWPSGWLGGPAAYILPLGLLNLPLSTWILERGFRRIPRAIDAAATLDGLGPIRRVLRIHLPLARPSAVTAAILSFIFSWSDFFLALLFLTPTAVPG